MREMYVCGALLTLAALSCARPYDKTSNTGNYIHCVIYICLMLYLLLLNIVAL